MAHDGALYFIREALAAEFADECRFHKLEVHPIAPDIFFSRRAARLYWVLDYWQVQRLDFASITEAAKKLRQHGKRWSYVGGNAFRRGKLIAERLGVKPLRAITYPAAPDFHSYGAFTLEAENELLFTKNPLKRRFAGGKLRFIEDKIGPPSRAYLKLYEVLTITGLGFNSEDHVLDLGATPGGWSYVAAQSGARVTMLDRSAPSAKLLKKFPQLQFLRGDGLKLPHTLLQSATVILSDMACEPAKLYAALPAWLDAPQLRFVVCTLKFHGLSDKALIARFARIPGASLYHLWHNGHELAWVWQRSGAPAKVLADDVL